MFRPMRRIKQLLPEAQALEIVKSHREGVMAVIGDGGYPYAVPLNYVYRGGKLFLHSAKSGHKIDAIRANDKVSFCIIDKDDIVADELTTYFRSVIIFGRARILDAPEEIFKAVEALGLSVSSDVEHIHKSINSSMKAMAAIEITIDHMTGKEAIELVRMHGSAQGE